MVLIASATAGLANALTSQFGSSHGRAFAPASRFASPSATALPFRGVQTALAFTHARPPLAATDSTIMSRYFSQLSAWSSPKMIFEYPVPWISTRWSFLYGAMVRSSPKAMLRPHRRRMSAAPAWSVGRNPRTLAGTPALRNAWSTRYGVHGSSRPGLRSRGILNAMVGTHSEWTPGEFDGSTAPNTSV